jgi:hypothetical protein
MYNPAANYLYPSTYSDGTPVLSTDLRKEIIPDTVYANEVSNYLIRFPAAFCPTFKYQPNSALGLTADKKGETENLYPVVCLGKK